MYMKKEILKLDDFGRGITYVDNVVTFVKNTIPKDIIDLKITTPEITTNKIGKKKLIICILLILITYHPSNIGLLY